MIEGYEIEENTAMYVRQAKTEEWVKNLERRMQITEEQDIAPTFARLTTILENQIEMSKERQVRQEKQDLLLHDQMGRLSSVLSDVEESYKGLRFEVVDMKEDIHQIKTDVGKFDAKFDAKISIVGSKVEALEDGTKVDVWVAVKKGGATFLITLVGALAGFVAFKFGWK